MWQSFRVIPISQKKVHFVKNTHSRAQKSTFPPQSSQKKGWFSSIYITKGKQEQTFKLMCVNESIMSDNVQKSRKIIKFTALCSFRAEFNRDPGRFWHFWPQIWIPRSKSHEICHLKSKLSTRRLFWIPLVRDNFSIITTLTVTLPHNFTH